MSHTFNVRLEFLLSFRLFTSRTLDLNEPHGSVGAECNDVGHSVAFVFAFAAICTALLIVNSVIALTPRDPTQHGEVINNQSTLFVFVFSHRYSIHTPTCKGRGGVNPWTVADVGMRAFPSISLNVPLNSGVSPT